MIKKFLLLSLLSIAQLYFGMDVVDVVPEPELVRLDDGHEWTLIRKNNPAALVPFLDLAVAWRSDDISDKGMILEEHPNHGFGIIVTVFDSLVLHRDWPHPDVEFSKVPLIAVRLIMCKEARSFMRSRVMKLTTENLIPSERIKYLRGRAFEKCCPAKNASERKDEAICLLALRKRKGNLVAQCPKEIVHLMVEPLFDAWVHQLRAKNDPEMILGAQLVFEDKK